MILKLLLTFGFIAVSFAFILISLQLPKITQSLYLKKKSVVLIFFVIRIFLVIIIFMQFWLLTFGDFPFLLLTILIAASLIALGISQILGAITGASIKEKYMKINVIWYVELFKLGFQHPFVAKILPSLGFMVWGSWITALIIFWLNPLGSTSIQVWIAIIIFISPTFISILQHVVFIIPIITSQYIDDDLRNHYLSESFSNLLYSTIYFIFPFYILQKDFSEKFSWLPPYWFLISVPLILFIILTVIPYFIGLYKFKNQSSYFFEWKKNWLQNFKNSLTLPDDAKKYESKEKLIKNLDDEITEYTVNNKFYDFIERNLDDPELAFIKDLQVLKDNKENILKWDIQLNFIERLKSVRENTFSDKIKELKEYITDELSNVEKELKQTDEKKNLIAGVTYSLLSIVITYLYKTYQDDLLNLINTLFTN